ncbi:MAG: carboxypeptidase regulatory-like domain-containing protein, partial [Alphaproteobacteria bacterium]|nr:carboxypeptidase regulatory-like domain-containing protein [Alphaproteobacteria bacterium]
MPAIRSLSAVFAFLVLAPAAAWAQASITGVVRDSSGAVLPGVTVEASSDQLIEKVRTAVTDGSGTYRLVDLRVGTYAVTYSLVGFNTFKREGIELTGTFTATINVELRIGSLEETITVSGESPIVDTQSVRQQTTIASDLIAAMPAARSTAGIMMLIPATQVQANPTNLDIQVTPGVVFFGGAGGRNNEGRIQVDGLATTAALNGGGASSYMPDIGNAQEITLSSSGGLGEMQAGGPVISIIPKAGGNSVKGTFYLSNVTDWMVGNNYTQALRDRGLRTPGKLFKLWDYNASVGGPIKKDRVWYFFQWRDQGSHRTVPGMFANRNMGDATKWTYAPDTSRPAVLAGGWSNAALRMTVQPTVRNKFNVFWDHQIPCQGAVYLGTDGGCRQSGPGEIICGAPQATNPGCSATAAPEVGTYLTGYGQRVQQATWTSPVTNRLLLEAGFGTYLSQWGGTEQPGGPLTSLVRVTEQCTVTCANNGDIPNLTYRSGLFRKSFQGVLSWRGAASFVTGRQSVKVGYQAEYQISNNFSYTNSEFLDFRVNNGVPNQLTQNINAFKQQNRGRFDAFYVQEQWTLGRVTLQGALRFDFARSHFPEQTVGAQRFLPTTITYPRADGVTGYMDLMPRGGLAWDVFGTGKTSAKISVGRYVQNLNAGLSYTAQNPSARLSTSVTRAWTDGNGNFSPDCDLQNPLAQDNRPSGGDFCGQISDLNFGRDRFSSRLDPKLLSGWSNRPGDGQYGVSVQQEVLPRVSVELGYNRRWLTNFTVTDNLAQRATDHSTFSITAPIDSRLPAAASGRVISGLFNVNQNVASAVDQVQTLASDYGTYSQAAHGILFNASARLRNGLVLQGGVNTNDTRTDFCDIRAALPEESSAPLSPTNPWCDTATGWV